MARPRKDRMVACNPEVCYFKPRGVPMRELEEVRLTVDEREALRLADLEGLSQEEAGQRMGVSRATFGRIIQHAHQIVADALINGKAIRVDGGNYRLVEGLKRFICHHCKVQWEIACDQGRSACCPTCGGSYLARIPE